MGVRPAREGRTGRGRRGASRGAPSTHGGMPGLLRGIPGRKATPVRSVLRFVALCQTTSWQHSERSVVGPPGPPAP